MTEADIDAIAQEAEASAAAGLDHWQARSRRLRRARQAARFGIGGSAVGMAINLGIVALLWPRVTRAQAGEIATGLDAAAKLADRMPRDVVWLCLFATIIMAVVLLGSVWLLLRTMEAQRRDNILQAKEFNAIILAYATKPCLLHSEDGKAVMERVMLKVLATAQSLADH